MCEAKDKLMRLICMQALHHTSRTSHKDDVMLSQDIFQSFQSMNSYASARPPLSGGDAPTQTRRSRKHSKSKNKDKMMSTMASDVASAFDPMDTTMTMASLPGGEKVVVRRATPNIAYEREDFEKSAETSAAKDGSGGVGGESSDVVAGKTKTTRMSWKGFKITGFICCFTGWDKEAYLHGESAFSFFFCFFPVNLSLYVIIVSCVTVPIGCICQMPF